MDEDRRRKENILNIILVGSIVMLVILDAIVLFYSLREGSADREISFGVFSLLPAFFIFLYVLSKRGHADLASFLMIAAYFTSDSYAAYRWGVTMQVVLITYALIIVTATILRGTKFGFFTTGLIAAFIISVGYAQYHGLIPTQVQKSRMADVVVFSVLYILIMVVAWLYDREIQRSLQKANASEIALKEERDNLEVKVIERTSELRQAQLEKMQQLGRFAELGQLSSGLFHDLLNLLNALSLRTDDQTDASLVSAFDTAKQIEGFVKAVRRQISDANRRELFSLIQGIDHAIQLLNYQANKEHVRIIFHPNGGADITHFDIPFKFQEVVINLLLNAIESYEGLDANTKRARTVEITIKEKNRSAILSVKDNGCGMAPKIRERIFEPFFTTKGPTKGTGIGLATIKKIIESDLSGTIAVESAPESGSTFTVTFPLCHEKIFKIDRPAPGTHPKRTGL